ncbi:DUF4249 domain-containing protein, partial [Bacteroidota bacterium]
MFKKILYLIVTVPMILGSCEEDIDVNLNINQNKRLVVDGSITNHPSREDTVTLSYTSDYFSKDKIEYIENADVRIADDLGNEQVLEYAGKGKYVTNRQHMKAEIGRTYTLTINHEGEIYSATSKMHSIISIDSIKWYYEYFNLADEYFYQIEYHGPEPPELGNHYMWHIYMNENLITDTLREVLFQEDSYFNGNYMVVDLYWFTEDEILYNTAELKSTSTQALEIIYPDTIDVRLEMFSISKRYYNFMLETMLET